MLCQDIQRPNASWLEDLGTTESVCPCQYAVALLCITQAYRIAVVSTVAPFEYVYILWASLIGYLIFADVPGPRTMIGGAVIVISGCYIILRERQQRGRVAAAAVDTGD